MDLVHCSIFDEKAGVYAAPFSAPSVLYAKRTFSDFCNDREIIIGLHPADFTLYKVGVFSTDSGKFVADFSMLGNGAEFVGQGPVAVTA